MEEYPKKEISRNILSVLTGVVCGIASFILLALFFFASGLLLWTDGGTKEEIASTEFNATISIILLLIIGSLVSGLVTALISFRNDILLPAITGITLIAIAIVSAGFDFVLYGFFEIIIILLVFPLSIPGGWIGNRIKKKRKSGI